MLDDALITFLSENKLFKGISHDALIALSQNMSIINLTGGEYLMHEGDPASDMYLLYQGRLRVYGAQDKTKSLAEIGVGSVVGELALLTEMPRVADVRAVRDSTLIKITQETMHSWILLHPESAMKMISDSIKRLLPPKDGGHLHPVTTLTIVPGEGGLDIQAAAAALHKAMTPYKKCVILDSHDAIVKQAIEKGETVSLAYLNACEADHDLLIYVANTHADPWSQQCIRQADKLLILVSDTLLNPSQTTHAIDTDKNILAEKYLLVLHPATTHIPKHTDQLLELTHADNVLHLRDEQDYQRIGRYFTGHAVSLVLSGGGLRGAAHIGLYYAFQEKGIPIDMVGGSSFGGLAAAGIGLRLPRAETEETLQWVHKTLPSLMDYTLPIVSFLRGERLHELLIKVFSSKLLLEDLWIPTFCTATNMTDADIKIFDRGLAYEAVRASISLPGIFPPVVHEGKILVDGATFNNLPVDIMRARNNGGKIIASSVSTDLPHEQYFARKDSVSGFDAFMDRFRAKPHTHLPSLFELLLNAEFVGAQRHMNQVKHMSDFYLDLNVSEHPMLDLKHWDEIVEKGYQRGLKLIDEAGLSRDSLKLYEPSIIFR